MINISKRDISLKRIAVLLKNSRQKRKQIDHGTLEVYSEPCQRSKMELFAKFANGFSRKLFSQKPHLRSLTGF